MKKFARLIGVGAIAGLLSMFVPASPVSASLLDVEVGDEPLVLSVCCVKGQPITLTLALPAGVELTVADVERLVDRITDFILEKEAALVDETGELIDDAEGVVRLFKDILRDVVIPFLLEVLGDVTGVVVLLKENVFNVCVSVAGLEDPAVCTDAE